MSYITVYEVAYIVDFDIRSKWSDKYSCRFGLWIVYYTNCIVFVADTVRVYIDGEYNFCKHSFLSTVSLNV